MKDEHAVVKAHAFLESFGITIGYKFNDPDDGASVLSGIGVTGKLICHPVGEPDMQSSWVMSPEAFAGRYFKSSLGTEEFQNALLLISSTYPLDTLTRRMGLLTGEERGRIIFLEKQIFENLEAIDGIISSRAEAENDPWP